MMDFALGASSSGGLGLCDTQAPIRSETKSKRAPLRAVDLYAGAGGLSLGLKMAGFEVAAAVELDHWAALTYGKNFTQAKLLIGKVAELDETFFERYRGIDLVAGGPPCQGFSVSTGARRKSRDERNDEVFHFLNAAFRLKPRAILMENVPALGQYILEDGKLLIDEIGNLLGNNGYNWKTFVVNSYEFGVPQSRERLIMMASLDKIPDILEYRTHGRGLDRPISTDEAIGDLPSVKPGEVAEDGYLPYYGDPENAYQRRLRSKEGIFWNHVSMRHSPRLVERFSAIPPGGNGASVWSEHPARRRGDTSVSGVRFDQNHRRISGSLPSPTITAYMYSTCLHPTQNRNLTVREAARLQSFPDSFRFWGKRTTLSAKLLEKKGLFEDMGLNQLNQVGNAVPPLLACAIGRAFAGVMSR